MTPKNERLLCDRVNSMFTMTNFVKSFQVFAKTMLGKQFSYIELAKMIREELATSEKALAVTSTEANTVDISGR